MSRADRYRKIMRNRRVDFEIVRRWRQTDEYVLRDKGRWGPKWLHRLVLRAAKNLGMLGHMAMYSEAETYDVHTIDTADKEFADIIFEAAHSYLDRDYAPNDLVVLIGPAQFPKLAQQAGWNFQYKAQVRIGGLRLAPRAEIYGFDVSVVDNLDGMIVVPKMVMQ